MTRQANGIPHLAPRLLNWVLLRLVRAEWVGGQRIAGMGEGAGPRSTADVAVLAQAAFAVEFLWRVESAKDFGLAIQVHQRLCAHAAAMQRQKAGGIHLAQIGNEDDAVAV